MSERHPSLPTVEMHARMLTPRQMAAIGAAATLLYSGAANHFNGENGKPELPALGIEMESHRQVVDINETPITIQEENGKELAVASDSPVGAVESEISSEQTQMLGDTMLEKWARQFADDVEAGKLIDPAQIDVFASSIKAEVDEGWTIDGIAFRGTTSAEDDTVNEHGIRTAGLQLTGPEAAQKQEELGNTRRDVGALQLTAELQERGISIDPASVELMPSMEDVLTDEEVSLVDQLAQSFEHETTTQMIEQWNRDPDSVDYAVDTVLTELLAKERTFQVEVSMSRAASDGDIDESGIEQEIIDSPEDGAGVIQTLDTHETSTSNQIRFLPIVIPGYIAFSLGRRKLQRDAAPRIVTETPGTGPLPPQEALPEEPPHEPPPPPPPPPRARFPRPQSERMPSSRVNEVAFRRKQPRNHNFHGRAGRLAGGSGRMSRSRGGNRSSKR